MLSTRSGERTSTHQTGCCPDLLPSGLYRRLRSFTGSWGLQALYAPSADCTGCLRYPLACRFTFANAYALDRALRTTPRGLYRRWGIGKARIHVLPSPCPEGRAFTEQILAPRRLVLQEKTFDTASYVLIIIARFVSQAAEKRSPAVILSPSLSF